MPAAASSEAMSSPMVRTPGMVDTVNCESGGGVEAPRFWVVQPKNLSQEGSQPTPQSAPGLGPKNEKAALEAAPAPQIKHKIRMSRSDRRQQRQQYKQVQLQSLYGYEQFFRLPAKSATIEQVKGSSAGIKGYAAFARRG